MNAAAPIYSDVLSVLCQLRVLDKRMWSSVTWYIPLDHWMKGRWWCLPHTCSIGDCSTRPPSLDSWRRFALPPVCCCHSPYDIQSTQYKVWYYWPAWKCMATYVMLRTNATTMLYPPLSPARRLMWQMSLLHGHVLVLYRLVSVLCNARA